MWTVDITFPTDSNLRMSQDLRGQIQIKRKGARINDYWSSFRIKQPLPPFAWPLGWSWINTRYKFRGKMSFSMAQPSSWAWKAAYSPSVERGEILFWMTDGYFVLGWKTCDPGCKCIGHAIQWYHFLLHELFNIVFFPLVLNMTKKGKCLTMATTSHLILKAQAYGYFKKNTELLLFRNNVFTLSWMSWLYYLKSQLHYY